MAANVPQVTEPIYILGVDYLNGNRVLAGPQRIYVQVRREVVEGQKSAYTLIVARSSPASKKPFQHEIPLQNLLSASLQQAVVPLTNGHTETAVVLTICFKDGPQTRIALMFMTKEDANVVMTQLQKRGVSTTEKDSTMIQPKAASRSKAPLDVSRDTGEQTARIQADPELAERPQTAESREGQPLAKKPKSLKRPAPQLDLSPAARRPVHVKAVLEEQEDRATSKAKGRLKAPQSSKDKHEIEIIPDTYGTDIYDFPSENQQATTQDKRKRPRKKPKKMIQGQKKSPPPNEVKSPVSSVVPAHQRPSHAHHEPADAVALASPAPHTKESSRKPRIVAFNKDGPRNQGVGENQGTSPRSHLEEIAHAFSSRGMDLSDDAIGGVAIQIPTTQATSKEALHRPNSQRSVQVSLNGSPLRSNDPNAANVSSLHPQNPRTQPTELENPLSSNTKPLPASPLAPSYAITGFASEESVDSAIALANSTVPFDPFVSRSSGQNPTAFQQMLLEVAKEQQSRRSPIHHEFPPQLGELQSSSSSTDERAVSEQAESEAWEAALAPEGRPMFDVLKRINRRIISSIIDRGAEAVEHVVRGYSEDAGNLLERLLEIEERDAMQRRAASVEMGWKFAGGVAALLQKCT